MLTPFSVSLSLSHTHKSLSFSPTPTDPTNVHDCLSTRYDTEDCRDGSFCDTFSLFKHEVLARARALAKPHHQQRRVLRSFVGPGSASTCFDLPCAIDCYDYYTRWSDSCLSTKCKECIQCKFFSTFGSQFPPPSFQFLRGVT